jgi:hypothetical protein
VQNVSAIIANLNNWIYFQFEPLFKDHLLKPQHHSAIFNNAGDHYWPSVVLFIVLAVVVVLKVTAPVRTLRVLNAAYSLQVAKQIEREDYSPFKRVSVLLSIIFVLVVAFLFFKLNQLYGSVLEQNSSLFQYLFFVMVVVVVYTIKFIVMNFVSFLTDTSHLFGEYINNTLIINQSIGLLLFPVIILAELSPVNPLWLVFPSVLFLVLGYLLRLYRGFLFAGIEEGIGFLQLFVYLCALEILPLLVLIKFLVVNF